MDEPTNVFWLEILLAVIGTLAMLILTGVLWFIRMLHGDIKTLEKTIRNASDLLREELTATADKVDTHEFTLFGPKGNNGLTGDVRELQRRLPDRRERPRQ